MTRAEDERWMRVALSLGRRHMGRTGSNPSVGCVIVKSGRVVGQGITAIGGYPHAEPQALEMAGSAAKDATAYVTLEPCAHFGKTPPCASALIDADIKKVVVGVSDPDKRVDGNGINMLRAANIETKTGILEEEVKRDLSGFLKSRRLGLPHVTLKLAQTIDGRIATASGESQWITGPDARRMAHLMRAQNDAILVGHGTVKVDNPALTTRLSGLESASPIRVVLNRNGGLPVDSVLLRDQTVATWVVHSGPATALYAPHIRQIQVDADATGKPDLTASLKELARAGIMRVFCEGGAHLAAALVKEKLIDELAIFTAPKLIGGTGLPSLADIGLAQLSESPDFQQRSFQVLGSDSFAIYTKS
ncbi:MAG: bifunctional diaminohydroxyphosphoribosylaminopyrimidine deaminase/5-amino-6-(5-phosphoribosylamino)uracil reductase RibD [Pseudomonadota bacterium]